MSGAQDTADRRIFLCRKLCARVLEPFVAVDAGLQRGFETGVRSVGTEAILAKRIALARRELKPKMAEDQINDVPGRELGKAVK